MRFHDDRRGYFSRIYGRLLCVLFAILSLGVSVCPQTPPHTAFLVRNVRLFNGTDKLSAPTNVLVVGNQIVKISSGAISAPKGLTPTVIDGGGRTLMPGLIDAHAHMMFNSLPQLAMMTSDIGFLKLVSGKAATNMLMRRYTSVRDLGGPSFGLKKAIDLDMVPGPCIWPSGAMTIMSGSEPQRLPTTRQRCASAYARN